MVRRSAAKAAVEADGEVDDVVDRAFDAMCAALGGTKKSNVSEVTAGAADEGAPEASSTTDDVMALDTHTARPHLHTYTGPPTALDYGADSVVSYLTGVDNAGSATVAADGSAAQTLALAAAQLATTEGRAGPLERLEPSARARKQAAKRSRKGADNAGDKWFGMPAGPTDPESETTLKLLRLRKYFNPKHFIKSNSGKTQQK
jgi:hypothetical protein